ncbi:hypothetical protein AM598_00435 [Paenibacillus polymyxa]|nr:hypothetical protein AM598_00435 [Paenibacillus polymyxa]
MLFFGFIYGFLGWNDLLERARNFFINSSENADLLLIQSAGQRNKLIYRLLPNSFVCSHMFFGKH